MLAERGADGIEQRSFYDEGVGTRWWNRISGGAFGAGLSENIRDGYRWLMENYDYGDEIYVFGFSRGAFTARSLVGLIAKCGLLKADAPIGFEQIFGRYEKGKDARPIYKIKYAARRGETISDFEEKGLLNHTHYHPHLVRMIGVWDTVGTIGINIGTIKGISTGAMKFHNTHLSTVVQHSYQALALDEHRGPFWAILWTQFVPDIPDKVDLSHHDKRFIEQRWFAGAHANVGGGYRNDLMPQRPLAWIQEKAITCGLAFRNKVGTDNEDFQFPVIDSYADFLGGIWKIFKSPYIRWVQSDPVRRGQGWVKTVNERIDRSVFERCQKDKNYRPLSLIEWAKRKEQNLEEIITSPDRYLNLWSDVKAPGIEPLDNHQKP